jgi:hypothetical protein
MGKQRYVAESSQARLGKARIDKKQRKKEPAPHKRAEPISLAPLTLEQALRAVMETGPHPMDASRFPKKAR